MSRLRFVFLATGIVLIANSTDYSFWSWQAWVLVILGGAFLGAYDAEMTDRR